MRNFKSGGSHEFEERIHTAKAEITALLAGERAPQPGTNLQTATRIAARSQSASEAAKGPEPINRKERTQYNKKVKPLEEKALIAWAKENNLWTEETDFNKQYSRRYIDEGAEQKVYLKEDGRRVSKVNTGHFHGTWLDFFNRLTLHRALFPSTVYTLTGFTDEEGQFCAVIEQPWVNVLRGASKEEIEVFLSQTGFKHLRFNDYYNKEHGIILEDLHDENIFMGPNGNLLFVDPVIYLETPDMGLGGKSQFRFPFGSLHATMPLQRNRIAGQIAAWQQDKQKEAKKN